MSVSSINPFTATPIDVGALSGINSTATILDALAPAEAGTIAANSNASIVDISDLGELLSATSNFQSLVGAGATGNSATPGFADIATAAQSFVDALNNFQTDSTSAATNPAGATFADQLLLEAETTASPTTSSDSFLTNLASVGLDYQGASALDGNAQFNLNLPTLEAAYEANPTLTATSLEQAFQTLGAAATTVAGQNLSLLSAQSSNLALSSELDTSLLDSTADEDATLNSTSLIPAATATADAQLQQSLADLALENAIATTTATETAAAQTVAADTAAATTATEVAAAVASNTTTDMTDTTDTANATNATQAQEAIEPTPLDTSIELASDPSVAAAVAAYRLGSQTANRGINNNSGAPEDVVTDVAAVSNVGPTTLDLHQNSNNASQAGVTQPASVQSPSEVATKNETRSRWHLVDVEA